MVAKLLLTAPLSRNDNGKHHSGLRTSNYPVSRTHLARRASSSLAGWRWSKCVTPLTVGDSQSCRARSRPSTRSALSLLASVIASDVVPTKGLPINVALVNLGTFVGALCFFVRRYMRAWLLVVMVLSTRA